MLNISEDLYEAASIDGAGKVGQFFRITLPLLRSTHFTVFILGALGSLKCYDIVYVLTGGGPNHATETFSTYIQEFAFSTFKQGRASTLVVFMFLIAMVITAAQLGSVLPGRPGKGDEPVKNSLCYRILTGVICLLATAFFLFPLGIMLWRSFQNGGFSNYGKVFNSYNLLVNFWASLQIVGGTLLVVMFAVSLAAYAFSKLPFPGKRTLYYILLTGMMIPTAAVLFPLFRIVRGMGLLGSPLSVILPYATFSCCFNLMILKNYYDSIPNEMMEAATIDGASRWQIFSRVMMPVAKPGLAVVLMQTFLSAWNELQMVKTFITDPLRQPLSVVPIRFAQTSVASHDFTTEVLYAALVICLVPVVVFYAFAARSLVAGLTSGAVKG